MKRLFLWACAVLVIASFCVYQIQQETSYLLIVLGDISIEMNLWFGVAAILLVLFICWIAFSTLSGSAKRLIAIQKKIVGRGEHKAQIQTTQGLIAFIEGDWSLAHKKLVRSARQVTSPIINYLAAARCAYEMGDEQQALELLHKAEKSPGNHGLAVTLTQVRMQLSNEQFEQALASLSRAEKIQPEHKVVLALQYKVYLALRDWSALKKLLPKLHEKNIGTLEDRYYLEQTLCQEMVKENVEKNKSYTNDQRIVALEGCIKQLPAHFRKDATILTLFINTLIELNAYDNVEKVLAKNINREWNESWVRQYGLLPYSHSEAALIQAESWLKQKPDNAVLHLTLGRLCLQNKQWGRAKDFFVSSIAIKPEPETYAELARLQRYLGEEKESQASYKKGLISAASTLLDVPVFVK